MKETQATGFERVIKEDQEADDQWMAALLHVDPGRSSQLNGQCLRHTLNDPR